MNILIGFLCSFLCFLCFSLCFFVFLCFSLFFFFLFSFEILSFLVHSPGPFDLPPSPQSLKRSRKRCRTTPSQRVENRLCVAVFSLCRAAAAGIDASRLVPPLLRSEVCRRLPRPVVGGDGAPRQRGAAQRGGVSVRLQGGPGLWRPGDSGIRHEGEEAWRQHILKWDVF